MNNSDLERHLKKTTKLASFISVIVGFCTTLFVMYGFYYKTTETQDEHSESIKEVKKDVTEIKQKINTAEIFQGVSQAELNALQDKVNVIAKTVDKMDDKVDKLLVQTK